MKNKPLIHTTLVLLTVSIMGCGNGSSNSASTEIKTIGGTISGLPAGGQVVAWEKDQTLTITSNGTFVFPNPDPIGANYEVYVSQQPTGFACALTNQSGTVGSQNVTNVTITCARIASASISPYSTYNPPAGCGCRSSWTYNGQTFTGGVCGNPDNDPGGPWCSTTSTCNGQTWAYCSPPNPTSSTFTIGGKVSGLDSTSQITLQNNGSQNLTLNFNGDFSFPSLQSLNSSYAVTIFDKSPAETCTVNSGSGSVTGDVTSVLIDCGNPNSNPSESCTCQSSWSYAGSTFQGCANPDSDPNGSWCYTTATCNGKTWSYCTR